VIAAVVASSIALAASGDAMAACGGDDHLWFVIRRGTLAARLGHVAKSMADDEYRECLPLSAPPEAIGAWGDQAHLLFPPRTALVPGHLLLSTTTRRNAATGLWVSVPSDRLELGPALPVDAKIESMGAAPDGPQLIFVGDGRAWQRRWNGWHSVDLPEPLRAASRRRLEPVAKDFSIVATSGDAGAWQRWRLDGASWTRLDLGVHGGEDLEPVGGPMKAALATETTDDQAVRRRILYLLDDGPIVLSTLDEAVPLSAAMAWFRGAPVFVDGEEGTPRMRRVDAITGVIGPPTTLLPQRSLASAWMHIPVLGAAVISLLMIVFFVRSLREESEQQLPEGWEPMPMGRRVAALGVDLVPAIVITKFAMGASWSSFLVMPWLVADADRALPAIVAPIVTVIIGAACEALFGTTLGKRLFGGRVVSMRRGAKSIDPTISQTLARNVFKAVVLQMQLLAVFTLLHPLGQGVGETVSATAVARRRLAAPSHAIK